jgi:HEAT repeat protein
MNGKTSGRIMKAAGLILAGLFMCAALPETATAKVTGEVRTPEARNEESLTRLDNLEQMVKDKSPAFRLTIAFSLGQIAENNPGLSLRVLKLLDDMHTDTDDMVRGEAAWQIGLIGLKHPERRIYATALLKSMVNDGDKRVRFYAHTGLRSMAHPELN